MPFANQHAARQTEPGKYDTFRRGHPSGFPAGVDVIYGIKSGKSEIQSVRFDSSKFTVQQAKDWLKEHSFKTGVEAATEKVDWPLDMNNERS